MLDKLFLSLFLIGFTLMGNTQVGCDDIKKIPEYNLIGTYMGHLTENNEALGELHITSCDSTLVHGQIHGLFLGEDVPLTFVGCLQEQSFTPESGDLYISALLLVKMFDDYCQDYQSINSFVTLTINIEFQTQQDDEGWNIIPTNDINYIKIYGIFHDQDGMDPENIEFELIKR